MEQQEWHDKMIVTLKDGRPFMMLSELIVYLTSIGVLSHKESLIARNGILPGDILKRLEKHYKRNSN